MPESPKKTVPKWHHPVEVMKLHKLKLKKRALQARINSKDVSKRFTKSSNTAQVFDDVLSAKKRKNPFITDNADTKKVRDESSCSLLDESTDQTLFKLLHQSVPTAAPSSSSLTSFTDILNKINGVEEIIEVVKAQGESWLPIDWTLKSKVRLLSTRPFPWNSKLKISEEASGVTGFTRCLNRHSETTLDTSPNAKFHQCCLYWQQPHLPWLTLFPRNSAKSSGNNWGNTSTIRDSLQSAWADSLRSLFQLIRTRQCPYFYACANNFTVLFRAAGLCGYADVHALIAPSTRGFRHMLRQEDIEFSMPLKPAASEPTQETQAAAAQPSCSATEEDEETPNEQWLKSMGCNADDIRQINYTQAKIVHKAECEVDHSEASLLLVEGVEVHALYNFLINCKSVSAPTGPLAGIPPTLLAPVAFHGATLNALKVRENKVHIDDADFYSLELSGPILPSTIHNLFAINSPEYSMTATFNNVSSTEAFSKVIKNDAPQRVDDDMKGSAVFGKENLSDCGLDVRVLKHFCTPETRHISNMECLKYTGENRTYTWS